MQRFNLSSPHCFTDWQSVPNLANRIMTEPAKDQIGSAFDDFLKEEGIFEEVQAGALKKVFAHQLGDAAKEDRGGDQAGGVR
jgi:hypothetical protein